MQKDNKNTDSFDLVAEQSENKDTKNSKRMDSGRVSTRFKSYSRKKLLSKVLMETVEYIEKLSQSISLKVGYS